MLTAEKLKAVLSYDASTGIFRRRHRIPGVCNIGDVAGSINNKGYACVCIEGRIYKQHRLAWLYVNGEWPSAQIDHINGVRDDNRIDNLRPATQSQNQGNMRMKRTNKCGFKGVYFKKSHKKWRAEIWADGAKRHLGAFNSPEAAHAAYARAAAEIFGEFARAA